MAQNNILKKYNWNKIDNQCCFFLPGIVVWEGLSSGISLDVVVWVCPLELANDVVLLN